ncbi:hypothetical protein V2G26_010890 [Clonostachys chloroleuca]
MEAKKRAFETRTAIVAAVQGGEKHAVVAERFGVSRATVTRLLRRLEKTSTLKAEDRKGRPKLLSPRDSRRIRREVRRDYQVTRKELVHDLDLDISATTVRRDLLAVNLRKWKAKKRIFLSKEAINQRRTFIQHWNRKEDELVEIIFSDECTVQNNSVTPNCWVWRFTHEAYDAKFVNKAGVPSL